jgi:UDP-glucuronate decarboxylase
MSMKNNSSYSDKIFLVTGGAGFIGSHLCKYILNRGNKVICLDNLYTGSKENIEELLKSPHFTFIEADITEQINIESSIDYIYNLACPASPAAYQRNPVETVVTNVEGMINVLNLARKKNTRVLQASTSEVYGDPLEHPQKESYRGNVNSLSPRACYDEGKRCAETICMDYHREYDTDVKIVRIFNTYGPNMAPDDGRVISNFIVQALRGDDITIYGDGKQTRSFQYIDDLINGLVTMMSTENFIGPVNIGNPDEFTILELAEKVKNLTRSNNSIIYKPLPADDPKQRQPDITLAREKLGWSPQIDIDKGLAKTIAYFRSFT